MHLLISRAPGVHPTGARPFSLWVPAVLLQVALLAVAAESAVITRAISVDLDPTQVSSFVDSVGNAGNSWLVSDAADLSDVTLSVGDKFLLDISFVGALKLEDRGNGFFDNAFGAVGFETIGVIVGTTGGLPRPQPVYKGSLYIVDEAGLPAPPAISSPAVSAFNLQAGYSIQNLTSTSFVAHGIHAEWEITAVLGGSAPFDLADLTLAALAGRIHVIPDPESVILGSGLDQSASAFGGSGFAGGVEAIFSDTGGGVFSAELSVLTLDEATSGSGGSPAANFALPSDPFLVWDLSYDGSIDGPITLTFSYDEARLLPLFPESGLAIYHHVDGDWVLEVGIIDEVANTITVTVDSLSPFALGALAAPEPAVSTLLVLAVIGAAARRSGRSGRRSRRPARGDAVIPWSR